MRIEFDGTLKNEEFYSFECDNPSEIFKKLLDYVKSKYEVKYGRNEFLEAFIINPYNIPFYHVHDPKKTDNRVHFTINPPLDDKKLEVLNDILSIIGLKMPVLSKEEKIDSVLSNFKGYFSSLELQIIKLRALGKSYLAISMELGVKISKVRSVLQRASLEDDIYFLLGEYAPKPRE
jgi:DNA-directed RNA polymerase specialized sigma24 family protein